jgi:hypothetical protein
MMPPRTPVQMEFSVSTGLSQDAGHKVHQRRRQLIHLGIARTATGRSATE